MNLFKHLRKFYVIFLLTSFPEKTYKGGMPRIKRKKEVTFLIEPEVMEMMKAYRTLTGKDGADVINGFFRDYYAREAARLKKIKSNFIGEDQKNSLPSP